MLGHLLGFSCQVKATVPGSTANRVSRNLFDVARGFMMGEIIGID
jgi:hypothetical protein